MLSAMAGLFEFVEKRKYPATSGDRVMAEVVGEDDVGRWLFARAGRGNRHRLDGLLLLPHEEWWVAWWWVDVDPLCTVDVVTPVRHDGDVWVYEDLEIDLAMRECDGLVNVVDLDEFAGAALGVPYPADVIVGAIGGMRSAERRMVDRHPPFDTGFSRLREVLGGR